MEHNVHIRSLVWQHRGFLSIIFMVALVIRALVFFSYLSHDERYWQVDSNTYHVVATNIAQGKGYVGPDGSPHFYRLPGYPLFLAASYSLYGVDKKVALLPQIVLSSTIPVLVFILSLILFPGLLLLARAAGIFAIFHLGLVLYAGFFMTETLFLFFFLLFLLFFFRGVHCFFCKSKQGVFLVDQPVPYENISLWLPEPLMSTEGSTLFERSAGDTCPAFKTLPPQFFEGDPGVKAMVFAGVFLGLASLVRPVGHYALAVSLIVLALSNDLWKGKFVKASVLSIAWLLPVCIWLVRNVMLTGYLFFHTLPGGHFLYLSAARVAMHVHDCSYQQARQILAHEVQEKMRSYEQAKGSELLEIERCRIHEQLAVEYFKKDLWRSAQYWLTDMFRTMFSLYSSELLYLESGRQEIDYFQKGRAVGSLFERYIFPKTDSWLVKMIIWTELEFFILLILGFLGFMVRAAYRAWHKKYSLVCALCRGLPFMVLFVIIALAGGYSRMRLPLEPLLIVYSCAGWFLRMQKGDHA